LGHQATIVPALTELDGAGRFVLNPMRHQPSPMSVILLYGVLFAMAVMIRRTKKHPANNELEAKQRLRPIMITWLDPFLVFVVAGSMLWALVTVNLWHALAALVGALAGVPIGVARANTQYVRAVHDAKGVVFRRSGLEYALLGLLLVLRIVEDSIDRMHTGPLTALLAALVALAVAESIARSAAITIKYYREAPAASTPSVE